MQRLSQYQLTESQDNLDDSNYGMPNPEGSAATSVTGGRRGEKESSGGWSLNLNLKERLFLFSFDLIELNSFYNFLIYCIFLIVDFVFIAYYPLNQMYSDFVVMKRTNLTPAQMTAEMFVKASRTNSTGANGGAGDVLNPMSESYQNLKGTGLYREMVKYDKRFPGENRDAIVSQVLSYLNLDYLLDQMNFETFVNLQGYFCHGFIAGYFMLVIMILTREPGTINLSGQRRFITKLFSFMIVTIAKTMQLPLITFLLKIFSCSNEEVYFDRLQTELTSLESKLSGGAASYGSQSTGNSNVAVSFEEYCYTGVHQAQVVYTSIIIVLYYSIVSYFLYFLTLSYPHEKLPWACLPTKIPVLREITKFMIVFAYQETYISQNALAYLDIFFAVLWLFMVYKRIKHVLIFHTSVYLITIIGESCTFVIFFYAAVRDFVNIDRNFILHVLLFISCAFMSYTVLLLREKVRQESLSRVDFALYEKDFDALIMMFTLHELIERSGYDEAQDFLLRGFIERHIEICEFTACSCIKYYSISNQNYRLELAQMSPFSRIYDSNQITSQGNMTGMQTRGASTSMVTTQTQVFTGRNEQSDGDELSTLKTFYGGSKKNQQKQNKKKSKFLKKFLIDNINVFLDIFPGSVKLHIMAAFIYFSIFKNSFKSLYELSFTRSKKSSLQDKYECFVLSSQVIAYFQSRASQGMSNQPMQFEKANAKDEKKGKKGVGEFNAASFEVESEIKSVIEFEKINITFQKMIEQTSILTRKFWQEILKKNIDVAKVFGLGAQIYKNFVHIKRQYKHLMQLNNNYLEVAYLYKLFVSLILNFEIEVEDAKLEIVKIMQGKSMKKHNLKTEYKTIQLLEENGMIIISGQTGNFGRILAMNNKAERTFGYATNELMGQKLHRLMPRLFAEKHEDLILNFINGNRRINKENHNFVWGKHKSNFIIPLIMEINAYVNFEFNFCFIAFLKRSILLEFKPMRELLEYQDIFVMQVAANGIIQDMTTNMQEYLNFPIQALQKDISVDLFFRGLNDDEMEQQYQNGRRVEFDPAVIRRILEQEDIDARGDNESDCGTNFAMSDKKCVAIVWLRNYDYTEQDVKLTYKEVWFVLTEDDASFLDTRVTTEGMTHMEGNEVKVNVTYTDDREEICSIASMSSLANYDKNRKNIMAKLSEIKTQTIDDQKPRQIDLLQKAIILVFLSVISIALLLLIVSTDRNSGFFTNLDIIHQSKNAAIYFSEVRLMLSTLVYFANSRFQASNYAKNPEFASFSEDMLQNSREETEQLRKIQSYMNFVDFDYSEATLSVKKGLISDYLQIRSNKIIEALSGNVSMIQGMQEYLDVSHDVTAIRDPPADFTFNTSLLNYDNTNSSTYKGQQIYQTAIDFYQLLKNGHGTLGNYLMRMSERYIADAIFQANNNSSLVLILTVVSIAITFLTAFIILPILHKIERSKEKVLMIYTELKKDQIESLNRNIKVFFMKLQTGANQVSGTLSIQNSTRQFSNKLMTRKFTMAPGAKNSRGMGDGLDDYQFLQRGASMAGIDMTGGTEMLSSASRRRGKSGRSFSGKESLLTQRDPLAALFQPIGTPTPKAGDSPTSAKKKVSIFRGPTGKRGDARASKKDLTKSKNFSEYSEDQHNSEYDPDARKSKHASGSAEDGDEDSEGELSENAQEDVRAQVLQSKEEAENALFKRIFQNKIKQMTCVRQVKYYALVAIISLLMSGYFTLSYFMVTQIFQDSQNALEIYDIAGNRGPYLDTLLSFFMQAQIRNQEVFVVPLDYDEDLTEHQQFQSQGKQHQHPVLNSIDYYNNLTQTNENLYSNLRRSMPQIIAGSSSYIQGLESQDMCTWLVDDAYVKDYNQRVNQTAAIKGNRTKIMDRQQLTDQCRNISAGMLQLGLQQATNNIIQAVLQGTLQFRDSQGGLLKQDKEQQMFSIIIVKLRYLNGMDRQLLSSIKQSILAYFSQQQQNYIVVFSVFLSIVVIAMILLSYYGVEYLFKNLIAIKFILNFIPGQWLIENNAAEDLKYVEF